MANIQENITTDACPSPPRDDAENETKADDEVDPPPIKIFGDKPRNKSGKKRQETTYVINISNSEGIHIGSNYTFNVSKNEKNRRKNDSVQKTAAIDQLLTSKEYVTTKNISFVSEHVDEGWRDVGRYFNYSDGQIHQFYEEHIQSGIKEVVYQILLHWIQNEPQLATVGKLASALWFCGQKDVVKRWSESVTENV